MVKIEGKAIWMVGLEDFGNKEIVVGRIGSEFLELFMDVVLDAGLI